MTRIKKPKRVLQQSNDYNRFKMFRKLKRKSKSNINQNQEVATKQLRKKLKLPK